MYKSTVSSVKSEKEQIIQAAAQYVKSIKESQICLVKVASKTTESGIELIDLETGCRLLRELNSISSNHEFGMKDIRVIHGLLEILVVRGIHIGVSPGLEFILSKRFRNGHLSKSSTLRDPSCKIDRKLFELIGNTFYDCSVIKGNISWILMDKYVADILALLFELANNPYNEQWNTKFTKILNITPTPKAMASLSQMLNAKAPRWVVRVLPQFLAELLQRRDGISSLIELLLGSLDPQMAKDAKFEKLSKLVCSIPSKHTPDSYVKIMSRQVFDLLTVPPQHMLGMVSSFLLSEIFDKHPEATHSYIISQLQTDFQPQRNDASDSTVFINDSQMSTSLDRLSAAVYSKNSTLIDRLISPISLTLWQILRYSIKSQRTNWRDRLTDILVHWIKLNAGVSGIESFIHNILWENPFAEPTAGSTGGIAFGPKQHNATYDFEQIDCAVLSFVHLLKCVNDPDLFTETVSVILKEYMSCSEEDTVTKLAYTSLLHNVLEDAESSLVKDGKAMIRIAGTIMQQAHQHGQSAHESATTRLAFVKDQCLDEDHGDDKEMILMAFRLINARLAQTLSADSAEFDLLKELQPALKMLAESDDIRISASTSNLLELISLRTMGKGGELAVMTVQYEKAFRLTKDASAPVRAQGIHNMKTLLSSGCVDINSIVQIFISLLGDEDSFVYLNAIKGLSSAADLHGTIVINTLIAFYSNDQAVLCERLRMGEALMQIIRRSGNIWVARTAMMVCENVFAVAINAEEDVNMKASALSILATMLESNFLGMIPLLDRFISLATHYLTVKADAMLKRASLLLLSCVIYSNGVEKLLARDRILEIERVASYLQSSDRDELVRTQAAELVAAIHR